jgi:hypothetical protein
MRIAICFYGLVGSKVGKNGVGEIIDPKIAYEYYKKHIFDINDEVDIFIHSWSYDKKEQLINLYKPKKQIIEVQKCFPESALHPKLFPTFKSKIKIKMLKFFKPKEYRNILMDKYKEAFRAYSRWYSSKKVLELKKEYEEENNFIYDAVMITRLDLGFFSDLDFSKYDMNYFYASHRNDAPTEKNNYQANYENHDEGSTFLDLWFFSNSNNMDEFAKLFDKIEKYYISPHRSSREHVDKFIDKEKVKYTLYRWFDHELIRRKILKSNDAD